MPNVKRGLFRIYITLASAVSIITVIIAVNTVMHINKTASIQIGFFQDQIKLLIFPSCALINKITIPYHYTVESD